MDVENQRELTEVQYWWVFTVAVLAPLASSWLESAWVFRSGLRQSHALIYYWGTPWLWVLAGLEFFFTLSSLILLRRGLGSFCGRWLIVACLYGLWTYVAFWIMQGQGR
jgi:hypothetical protein